MIICNYFHIVTVKLCFMPVNEEFKRLIDKIKYEFSINQAQISERLGVKSTYLSDMINGRVPYNESMQKKIHEVFHIGYEDSSSIQEGVNNMRITSEIISSILDREGLKAATFAKSVGVVPTQIYDLQKGKIKKISEEIADKIISVYPHYNKVWLLTGEGDMLTSDVPPARSVDIPEEIGDGFNPSDAFMSNVGMLIRANFQHRDIKYDNKSNRPIKHARVRKKHGRYTFWMRQIELFGPF